MYLYVLICWLILFVFENVKIVFQLVLWVIALSTLILKRQFSWRHYLACFLVLCGCGMFVSVNKSVPNSPIVFFFSVSASKYRTTKKQCRHIDQRSTDVTSTTAGRGTDRAARLHFVAQQRLDRENDEDWKQDIARSLSIPEQIVLVFDRRCSNVVSWELYFSSRPK